MAWPDWPWPPYFTTDVRHCITIDPLRAHYEAAFGSDLRARQNSFESRNGITNFKHFNNFFHAFAAPYKLCAPPRRRCGCPKTALPPQNSDLVALLWDNLTNPAVAAPTILILVALANGCALYTVQLRPMCRLLAHGPQDCLQCEIPTVGGQSSVDANTRWSAVETGAVLTAGVNIDPDQVAGGRYGLPVQCSLPNIWPVKLNFQKKNSDKILRHYCQIIRHHLLQILFKSIVITERAFS